MNTSARAVNVCFHGIGIPQRELEEGEDRYWITLSRFEAILDAITSWPDVHISFDDGNRSDLEYGLPALRQRGLTATFFVLAGRLNSPGSLRATDVRELAQCGMRVGTHGMDHRPWRGMDPLATRRELVDARSAIAGVAGTVVEEAAVPLGRYDRHLLQRLRSLGYRRIHTSDRRIARPGSWIQPRFSVMAQDSVDDLRAQIAAAGAPLRHLYLDAVGVGKRWR